MNNVQSYEIALKENTTEEEKGLFGKSVESFISFEHNPIISSKSK